MKWFNLRKNKCPQCNKDFLTGLQITNDANGIPTIFNHKCGFKISEQRYREIVSATNEQSLNLNDDEI